MGRTSSPRSCVAVRAREALESYKRSESRRDLELYPVGIDQSTAEESPPKERPLGASAGARRMTCADWGSSGSRVGLGSDLSLTRSRYRINRIVESSSKEHNLPSARDVE